MSIQKHIVSRDDSIYEAWPDLVQTDKGDLLCVFTECEHHGDRSNSRIVMCKSHDRGRTWTKKEPFSELTQRDNYYNGSRISKLRDGTLAVVCDRIKEDEVHGESIVYLWKGDCTGEEWVGPVPTPVRGIVPDKLQELSTGRWILAAHAYNKNSDKLEQYLWYSDDKGETWSDKIVVAADSRYSLCEVSILELTDGILIAFMRENSFMGYDCMKTISYDHGETWSSVYNLPIPGCHRPVAGFLQDGTIMITHRFLQGGKWGWGRNTQNVFAALISEDNAKAINRLDQWVRIIPIDYDRSPVADLGYTGWTQFDDGEIYVVNYIVDAAPKAHIRGYSFTMDDVVLPRPE